MVKKHILKATKSVSKTPLAMKTKIEIDDDKTSKPLSISERRAAYGRLQTSLAKCPKAAAQWQKINELPGRGAGKNTKKSCFLFASIDSMVENGEPFGECFWTEIEELCATENREKNGVWCTLGRLSVLLGPEEAVEMTSNGELLERITSAGRKQFFYVEDSMKRSVEKKRKLGVDQKKRITRDQIEDARDAFEKLEMGNAEFTQEEVYGADAEQPASPKGKVKSKGKNAEAKAKIRVQPLALKNGPIEKSKGKGKSKGNSGKGKEPNETEVGLKEVAKDLVKLEKLDTQLRTIQQDLKSSSAIKYTAMQQEELKQLIKDIDNVKGQLKFVVTTKKDHQSKGQLATKQTFDKLHTMVQVVHTVKTRIVSLCTPFLPSLQRGRMAASTVGSE